MSATLDRKLHQAAAALAAGDHARTEELCRAVLGRAPDDPHALRLMGILRLREGRASDAIPYLRGALHADPANLAALDALAAALTAVGDHALAEEMVVRGLALDASRPAAYVRLGMALASQGKWGEAARAFEDAIERDPAFPEAHHNLGDALTKLRRPDEAIDCFRRALAIDPDNPETHNSLGFALQELNLWGAAAGRYQRALALDPAFAKAHYNFALTRLFHHDFDRGWPEYEYRLKCEPVRATLRKRVDTVGLYEGLSRWRGPGDTGTREVGIWAEQGIGDQVLFSTLIPDLIGTGVSFVYEVDPRLLPAYQRAFPHARFQPFEDPPREALQRANRVLLAGSLPGVLRRSRADFDRQPSRLLSALPERVAFYRRRLEALGPGLKVAMSWRSTREDWWVQKKNSRLADLIPVLNVPGARFIDVQYGDTAGERSAVEALTGVPLLHFDEVDYYHDLEELLAILEACDLVITTSNATAHFAGVLGKRTWLLYPADQAPFHYWAHGGSGRSLWYPSVEILSAARFPDWPSLARFAASRLAGQVLDCGLAPAGSVTHEANATTSAGDAMALVKGMRLAGRLDEAIAHCRRALASASGDGRVWNELAHALRWQGELEEAHRAAVRATQLTPGLADAWFNLGAVQSAQGEAAAGMASYRKALDLKPDFAECWSNLGDALGASGDGTGEIQAYRRAVGSNPQLAPAWSNLGAALLQAGRIGEALHACQRATEQDPDFASGWNNLANALQECGEHEAAVNACDSALRLAPDRPEAWSTRGAALHSLGRYDDAILAYRNALDVNPGDARHHYSLGLTLLHCGRGEEAIASFRRALAIDPDHAQSHWDLSIALLGSGQLAEGWEEYEWRWRRRGADRKRHEFAAWDGDASKPRRLLLWAEQGVGDQILYASMIPDLVTSPLDLTVEIDPRLAPLVQRSFPGIAVIPQTRPPAASAAGHDCQAPLGSLGRRLRRTFDSFPRHRGYLKPDPLRAEAYRKQLLGETADRLVGISWKSANRELGALKSRSLRHWLGILRVPHARFVDLQYGETAREREGVEPQAGTRIEHLPDLDLYHDLDGLAALCAACDLVITVSNVTAHVAGALGRPAWLIAPQANGRHWYWFSGRTGSPWYPSLRIFTQQAAGDWSGVLDEVAQELAAFIKAA